MLHAGTTRLFGPPRVTRGPRTFKIGSAASSESGEFNRETALAKEQADEDTRTQMFSQWGETDRPSPTRQLTARVVGARLNTPAEPQTVDVADDMAQTSIETKDSPPVMTLRTACHYLPHPDKIHYGGEDAHFISNVGGGAFGVADGVGGWQESGVNPAEYSRTLMQVSAAFLEGSGAFSNETRNVAEPLVDPRGALHAAHMRTKVAGSATACVMQLDQARRMLVAANLGDSGFIVIRNGKVFARSKPLQHYFDCPLQLGAYPEYVEATDTADMADLYRVPLHEGDVIVAGSDGLWDNVFDHEIISLVASREGEPQAFARSICQLARKHASDHDFPSPYTREALAQGYDLPWWEKLLGAGFRNGRFQLKQLTGGKQDDITVLVSRVVVQ